MPLSVLVVIVAIGLTVVIAAVHFFGGKRPGALDDEIVRFAWEREFGGADIDSIVVSRDRLSACVILGGTSRLGLVCQMGAHYIARNLEAGSVRGVTENRDRLDLWLNDTTLNHVRLQIDDDMKRADFIERVEKLTKTEGQSHA